MMGAGAAVWTIIIVAVAMWFLSNLFRGGEDERAKGDAKGPPRRTPAGRGRPAGNDIDRFLEEINRRRKQAAERESTRTQPPPPPAARPRPRTRTARPEAERGAAIPMVLPVEPARREAVRRPAPPPEPAKPQAVRPVEQSPAPVSAVAQENVAPVLTVRPQPPALTQLQSLLRTPQSLRTAFLLKEILGPPRCRRQ